MMPAFRGFGARDQTVAGHLWDLGRGKPERRENVKELQSCLGCLLKAKEREKAVCHRSVVRAHREGEMSVSAKDVEEQW